MVINSHEELRKIESVKKQRKKKRLEYKKIDDGGNMSLGDFK